MNWPRTKPDFPRMAMGVLLASMVFSCRCSNNESTVNDNNGLQTDNDGSDTEQDSTSDSDSSLDSDSSSCVHVNVEKACEDRWCRIPAGCHIAGSPEDEPGHAKYEEVLTEVTLTHDFVIGQYEVTQKEWTDAGFYNPSSYGPNGDKQCADPDCPLENINWFEAVAYANRMSEAHAPALAKCYVLTGCQGEVGKAMVCEKVEITGTSIYDCEGFRLPTAAEREYAARAGTRTAFYSGPMVERKYKDCPLDKNVDPIAWYCGNSGGKTHPVGQKRPNDWGLYDVSGNVFEFIHDQHTGLGFGGEPITDPVAPFTDSVMKTERDARGGGAGPAGWSVFCRSASYYAIGWDSAWFESGMRLARTVLEQK